MIDFNLIKELSVVEGNVVKIENEISQVIWEKNVKFDRPIKLGVEKVTATTYAGETTYENEEFILLDIYPETADSIINVTYEGLTKTLTFNGTNAKQVYFGTFNGVSDSVSTPSSGIVTIEGQCIGFGCSFYNVSNKNTNVCSCITEVYDFGNINIIPTNAFRNCTNLEITEIPISITAISDYAFYRCTNLALTSLPSGITSIGDYAFDGCTNLALTSLPNSLTSIGYSAFNNCLAIDIEMLPEGLTSIGDSAFYMATILEGGSGTTTISVKTSDLPMYRSTVTFPSTLTSIGMDAFRTAQYTGSGDYFYLTYIETAIMLSETPPVLGDDAFGTYGVYSLANSNNEITFIVPKGCVEAYKTAEGWSNYASNIVEAS